jgi:Cu/Ag efflux protein CusF
MKKAAAFITAFICLFAFASMSCADDVKTVEKPKVRQITGQVVTLDVKAGTLTVKSKRQEVALETDEKTKVKIGREKKEFAHLQMGDRVKAKYIQVDGRNTAKSISIMSSTAEAMK